MSDMNLLAQKIEQSMLNSYSAKVDEAVSNLCIALCADGNPGWISLEDRSALTELVKKIKSDQWPLVWARKAEQINRQLEIALELSDGKPESEISVTETVEFVKPLNPDDDKIPF